MFVYQGKPEQESIALHLRIFVRTKIILTPSLHYAIQASVVAHPKRTFGRMRYYSVMPNFTGRQTFELSVGQHLYPFTFALPSQIPASFEGRYGYIRYTLRVTALRPWMMRNYVTQVTLSVVPSLDLNVVSGASVIPSVVRLLTNFAHLYIFSIGSHPSKKRNRKRWGSGVVRRAPLMLRLGSRRQAMFQVKPSI